jgi:hypothetical protein
MQTHLGSSPGREMMAMASYKCHAAIVEFELVEGTGAWKSAPRVVQHGRNGFEVRPEGGMESGCDG